MHEQPQSEGAAAQEPREQTYADTPIEPVTLERLTEIFDTQALEYRLEKQPVSETEEVEILRTGFINAGIALQVREDTLVVDSVWRGNIPAASAPQLVQVINDWNREHFAPTLRFFQGADEHLSASGVRELDITHGASRNQLGSFVLSSLDWILQSFDFLENEFPHLVHWEENLDD